MKAWKACVSSTPVPMPLTNATLPYILRLADLGYKTALRDDADFRSGLNIHAGLVTHRAVAKLFKQPFVDPAAVLVP